jgi:hypothetical protein
MDTLAEIARRRMLELRNAFSSQSMARNPILSQIDPRDMAQGLSATQPMNPAVSSALVGAIPGIGDAIGLGQDVANYASDPSSRTWGNGLLSLAALLPGVPRVIRPKGWNAAVDNVDELSQPGHLYRGMTKEEYDATVGAGHGVKSRGDYSHSSEGTNFAGKFSEAESYANYGHTDPRKTGKPNYVVEVAGDGIPQARDGYYKAPGVAPDRITRVWELLDQDGEIVARQVR